ncbi:MAG: CRISPR-associated protein Cas4 [Deinococcales bacterium]
MVNPNEMRQYHYCPRVIFYERCTPVFRRETLRMRYGKEAHDVENALEKQRSLQRYGLHEGQREFNVQMYAPNLDLFGTADLIVTVGAETYPVEFKDSTRAPDLGHEMQVCAYGLLLEMTRKTKSPRGYWHSTRTRETFVIEFSSKLRKRTLAAIADINDFIRAERCPEPTVQVAKCIDCELKNFCGDVL